MANERRVAVIGASGQIGNLVVRALAHRGIQVVAVGRRPSNSISSDTVSYRKISSYDYTQLMPALSGCTDAIATVGLPYRAQVWNEKWPYLVNSIVSSVKTHRLPLTFLDNLYVYGRARSPIPELAPVAPCSKKGSARLKGTNIISQTQTQGQDFVICRSADFLGPGAENTVMPWSYLKKVVEKEKHFFRWFGRPDVPHSFALPFDVAHGLVETCLNVELRTSLTLHLPVITEFSANDLSRELSSLVGQQVNPTTLGRGALTIAGVFSMAAREQREMMYQFENPYVLDDTTFRSRVPDFPQITIKDVLSMLIPYTCANGNRS